MAGSANPQATAIQAPRQQPSPQPSPNVFSQSANALQRGIQMAGQGGGGFAPVAAGSVGTSYGYSPASASAGTAVGGINQYMNPYTNQVVDTSMADLERQRLMQQNAIGAQAGQAGAFGGSRHGVAEALTNEAFARQGGQLAAGLRQQGFQTALGASQQDVANQLQASMANAAAANQASQFGQQSALQASLANQQAQMEAQRLNQAASLQQGQLGIQGASTLGQLSNLGFGQGMQIMGQQAQQGALQQALQQQLIDAARGQYEGFANAPLNSLNIPLQALGAAQYPTTQTTSRKPGLFDYLTMTAQAASGTNFAGKSDPRLKTNVQHKGQFNGVNFYSWEWNDEGKRVANPAQPTFGVMADELQKTHPQHVSRGEDGYLQVHYADLMRELVEAA